MAGFLSPSVEQVIPLLAQTCDELTRQALIRELTKHTEELCKGDPDLADTILEGKKTLQGCVRYVLEQAAKVVAKNVEAMTEKEFDALGKVQVRGKKAAMAGGMVGSEEALGWATDYYYKAPEERVSAPSTSSKKKDAKKKASDRNKPAVGATANAATATEPKKDKAAMNGGEQITMAGFAGAKDAA